MPDRRGSRGARGSGGSGTTSSGFSSGLPPNESLRSLDAADTTRLCQAIAAYGVTVLPDPKEISCKLSGIGVAAAANASGTAQTDADVQKACNDFVSGCQGTPAQDAGGPSCQIPSGPCNGTVADVEACATDETKATQDAVSKLPDCASLTVQDLKPSDGGGLFGTSTVRPASDDSLEAKCPGWSFVGSRGLTP